MQREEKQQDAALEAIIMRVNDLKNSIGSMLVKLEHEYETLNWPSFLDNFALMSGHVSYISLISNFCCCNINSRSCHNFHICSWQHYPRCWVMISHLHCAIWQCCPSFLVLTEMKNCFDLQKDVFLHFLMILYQTTCAQNLNQMWNVRWFRWNIRQPTLHMNQPKYVLVHAGE